MAYIFSRHITASNLGLMRKCGNDKCKKCNIPLKENDECYHRTGQRPVWYHKTCYESLRL